MLIFIIVSNCLIAVQLPTNDSLRISTDNKVDISSFIKTKSDTELYDMAKTATNADSLLALQSYLSGKKDGTQGNEKTKYYFTGLSTGILLLAGNFLHAGSIIEMNKDLGVTILVAGTVLLPIFCHPSYKKFRGSSPKTISPNYNPTYYQLGFYNGSRAINAAYYKKGRKTLYTPILIAAIFGGLSAWALSQPRE